MKKATAYVLGGAALAAGWFYWLTGKQSLRASRVVPHGFTSTRVLVDGNGTPIATQYIYPRGSDGIVRTYTVPIDPNGFGRLGSLA